jgi:hypothetical protein
VNERAFGENNDNVAKSLLFLAILPSTQQACDKAEPYLLRAVSIDESLFGKDGDHTLVALASLGKLYEKWDKPNKAEPCYRQELVALDKQYGADSPVLLDTLTRERPDAGRILERDDLSEVFGLDLARDVTATASLSATRANPSHAKTRAGEKNQRRSRRKKQECDPWATFASRRPCP